MPGDVRIGDLERRVERLEELFIESMRKEDEGGSGFELLCLKAIEAEHAARERRKEEPEVCHLVSCMECSRLFRVELARLRTIEAASRAVARSIEWSGQDAATRTGQPQVCPACGYIGPYELTGKPWGGQHSPSCKLAALLAALDAAATPNAGGTAP